VEFVPVGTASSEQRRDVRDLFVLVPSADRIRPMRFQAAPGALEEVRPVSMQDPGPSDAKTRVLR
jgi:hypothetical protein